MRRLLTPFLLVALLAGPAWAATLRNFEGDNAVLTADEDETAAVTCVNDILRITATGTLSSGDNLYLEMEDFEGAYIELVTWGPTDMPLAKEHACAGRQGTLYKVTLNDADDSSDVNTSIWVVPRVSVGTPR